MSDMLKVIEPKSDQINAEDLIGRDMTITISAVKVSPGTEQPVAMKFEGSEKLFRPCKTVSRIIVAAWGADTSLYAGRSLTLFRDPNVKWAGMAVGGIRVKAISHIDQPLKLALAESKQNRKITVVQPLKLDAATTDKPDEVTVWALNLIKRLEAAPTAEALVAITEEGIVIKRRQYLADTKPELAKLIDAAIAAGPVAEGRDDADHGDGFPGDDTTSEQEGN